MFPDWHQLTGLLGAATLLSAYFLLQIGRMKADSLAYPTANAIGAGMLCVSLVFDFNLSALIIEAFWVLVSLIGIARWVRARANSGVPDQNRREPESVQ